MYHLHERKAAAIWAAQMLAANCLILDTETTSFNGYVVQVGMVNASGKVLIDSLVNPLAPIEAGALAVHGISPAHVKDAPTFAAIHTYLAKTLPGRKVLVYNVKFDTRILGNEHQRLGCPIDPYGNLYGALWLDVMVPYANFVGERDQYGKCKWQKLPAGDHSAVGDCQATLKILREMAAAQ